MKNQKSKINDAMNNLIKSTIVLFLTIAIATNLSARDNRLTEFLKDSDNEATSTQKTEKEKRRPLFIGLQPGITAEPYYDENEFDINIIPITIQFPVGKRTDIRMTYLANYHFGGETTGFADMGIQTLVPVYFKAKKNAKDLPKGFYAGPMIGFSRNLLFDHYTTNLAVEAGYQFPVERRFSVSMGLQFGATYFDYDNQPNVWRNHFGFKVNIGLWVNK